MYFSGFEFKGGKLVMDPVEDPKNLEKGRAELGLRPLAEYIKMMGDLYHLEVVIPKN